MGRRDTSRDGFGNKLQTFALTHFKGLWRVAEGIGPLRRKINKTLVNGAVYKIPTRPYAFSTLSPYSSWESLTDRSWTGRHLPPDPEFNKEGNLPPVEDVAALFRKRDGKTISAGFRCDPEDEDAVRYLEPKYSAERQEVQSHFLSQCVNSRHAPDTIPPFAAQVGVHRPGEFAQFRLDLGTREK